MQHEKKTKKNLSILAFHDDTIPSHSIEGIFENK
jgi:hypothetical protein